MKENILRQLAYKKIEPSHDQFELCTNAFLQFVCGGEYSITLTGSLARLLGRDGEVQIFPGNPDDPVSWGGQPVIAVIPAPRNIPRGYIIMRGMYDHD